MEMPHGMDAAALTAMTELTMGLRRELVRGLREHATDATPGQSDGIEVNPLLSDAQIDRVADGLVGIIMEWLMVDFMKMAMKLKPDQAGGGGGRL